MSAALLRPIASPLESKIKLPIHTTEEIEDFENRHYIDIQSYDGENEENYQGTLRNDNLNKTQFGAWGD